MKIYFLILLSFILFSCSKKTDSDSKKLESKTFDSITLKNTEKETSVINSYQAGFNLTHNIEVDSIDGKPVKFYIENKNCDSLAIAFYYGKYRPTDDNLTKNLLALSSTNDKNLRSYYRWILDKTIEISDGALAEYPGVPARKYAEKFPEELFNFLDSDTSKTRYSNWTDIISYSGFYETDDFNKPNLIRKKMAAEMIKNSSIKLQNKIAKFTLDCFPDINKIDQ
ncbi:hypothetical protein [Flavobacterium sp.]|uniref:hypothetical protein n=1 Tax=Flavobacterium sp. TaxID=239 RepID=UPI002602A6E0|nr:hypothetical protein [Flavobacterium sp.]